MLHVESNINLPPISELLFYDKIHYRHSDSSEDEEDASSIELPPLKDINSPSPLLQPMHPKQYEQYPVRRVASPASVSSGMDSPFQRSASPLTIINKCRHLHGRSLSADHIAYTETPPWISEPLRIITAFNPSRVMKRKPQPVTRKYACHYCRKTFTRPSSLRTHTYSHTGQKPFSCMSKDCGKRFSVLSNMRRHMRRHSSSE